MSAYDEDSFSTEAYSTESFSFVDLFIAGWKEVKRFSLGIVRNFNFNLKVNK